MRSEEAAQLRRYISDLEYRLQEYHSWLEQSIAERDRLALDAAWGVHAGLVGIVALIAVFYVFAGSFKQGPFWQAAIGIVLAWVAPSVAVSWSNSQRMKEVERFAKLPEWEWKGPDFD